MSRGVHAVIQVGAAQLSIKLSVWREDTTFQRQKMEINYNNTCRPLDMQTHVTDTRIGIRQ